MKKLLSFIVFIFVFSFTQAQPCKLVKTGMAPSDVLKLVGKPTKVDSLGSDIHADGSKNALVVWQYGDVMKDGNQRVEFSGNKVTGIIADGQKYDALLKAFKNGDVPKEELSERIGKLNKEACK